MGVKQTKIIDLNLFSGSSETLRQELGGFYFVNGNLSFTPSEQNRDNLYEQIKIGKIEDEDTSKILPSIMFPVRFLSSKQEIRSDEEWKKYLVGGEFAEKNYRAIYNQNVYFDHFIGGGLLPYEPKEISLNTSLQPSIILTTEYYQYMNRYQDHTFNLQNILDIPNYYLLSNEYFNKNEVDENFPRIQYPYIKDYLNNEFINEPTIEGQNSNKKNLFVLDNQDSLYIFKNNRTRESDSNYIASEEDLSKIYSLMPFANKLELKSDLLEGLSDGRFFRDIINQNDYQFKFVKNLKEMFQNEIPISPSNAVFGLNVEQVSSSFNSETNTVKNIDLATTNNLQVRIVDVPEMMLYFYKQNESQTDDIFIIDETQQFKNQQLRYTDSVGAYRNYVSEKTLDVLNDFKEKIDSNFLNKESVNSLIDFFNEASISKYYETIAFRIEKIGGPPTGDARTQNTVQNIWFYNTGAAIKYIDTQIKYDTDYTYNIYAYVIIEGLKYQTTDLVVTRKISEDLSQPSPQYCLEFYNPFTSETSEQLFSDINLSSLGELSASYVSDIETKKSQLSNTERLYDSYSNEIKTSSETAFQKLSELETELDIPYPTNETRFSSTPEIYENANERLRQFVLDNNRSCLSYVNYTGVSQDIRNIARTTDLSIKEVVACKTVEFFQNTLIPAIDSNVELYSEILDLQGALTSIPDSNLLASNAQIVTHEKYMADFNIKIEPSVKIVEIPLQQKTMRVLDHPPNKILVSPYHLQDQTNRLAFYLKYDVFSPNKQEYPEQISPQDELNSSRYKIGKDFISTSKIKEQSVSPLRYIQIFRTESEPTSYASFEGSLRKTIDLKQKTNELLTDHIFMDRVKTNKKYYYVFRALNDNFISGPLSPIYETELIDDGGYIYGSFNQLKELKSVTEDFKSPTLEIKKLMNIIPNIRHLKLNTGDLDLSKNSVDEIGSVELGDQTSIEQFWDQKFKIRLTSKKTGRKLDVNIKFVKKESN